MNDPVIIGIDPGKTGAVAAVRTIDGHLMWVADMSDLTGSGLGNWLATELAGEQITTAWVEHVASRPGQSAPAMWTFGVNYGALLGALGGLAIRVAHVTPQKWKRAFGLNADKNASRQRATEFWPENSHMFQRVKDDGRAEAALIARYGWMERNKW